MNTPENTSSALVAFVHEILRQRDLLRTATKFDVEYVPHAMELDEKGTRHGWLGPRRHWTHRDKRLRDEQWLLYEQFPDYEFKPPMPRTERLWKRFRKKSGIPSYLKHLQAAMTEAQGSPAYSELSEGITRLAEAHDEFLQAVGIDFRDSWDPEVEPKMVLVGTEWDDYKNAVESLLPFLPPGSVRHNSGVREDKHDPVYMAGDIVLPTNAPAEISVENPTAVYPIPDDYERDKWIHEQRIAGRTNPEIIDALNDNKNRWTPLYSEDSIRDAVKRYCLYHGLPVPQGRRGRPTTKTGKPRKPPSKNPH